MLIKIEYYYQIVTGVDNFTIIVKNNYSQRDIVMVYTGKKNIDTELNLLKIRLNSTGLYNNKIFYPKTGEQIGAINNLPKRKKILIDNEYLRS